jgi:hypothetical protein
MFDHENKMKVLKMMELHRAHHTRKCLFWQGSEAVYEKAPLE